MVSARCQLMISGPNLSPQGRLLTQSPGLPGWSDDDLLPVRMLNEFCYCPRLGYLEWVQGEWADNLDTLEGSFGHRNVDKPDRQQFSAPQPATSESGELTGQEQPPAPESDKIHARSLMLSSEADGIIAKLDVLELSGELATPVDYKRGHIPDNPESSWEPERVQLCAQGLILRANGYRSEAGIIYYIASRKRVTIPFTEELIKRTRQLIADFRQTAASGICPPPLEDSPKCPRCSLVGICLPDETNLLLQQLEFLPPEESIEPVAEARPPRKLLPARQHALPLYIQQQGAFVGKTNDRITVKLKGEELANIRLLDISQVCAYGNVTFSAHAIKELTLRQIPIVHLTYGGWFHSLTAGLHHKNVELRIRQFRIADDQPASLQIARQMIAGKIKNCRTLLRRHLNDPQNPVLRQLNDYGQRALQAESPETLLGLEGMAAKEYFTHFFPLLAGHHEFNIEGRNRRPPRDPVNAVLSFVYSLLTKELTVALSSVGFDPMLGFFHRPRYGRPSLALDLAEEFRPLIADSVTLTAFNNGEINRDSFLERASSIVLTDAGRKSVIAAFERRMNTEITHPLFGYKVSYRRILEVQARLLARHVLGELPQYPNFTTR